MNAIEVGKIYDLRYGIYYGCTEIIPATNKVKVTQHLLAECEEDEHVVVRSIEDEGLHGGRELTMSVYDFKRAIGAAA